MPDWLKNNLCLTSKMFEIFHLKELMYPVKMYRKEIKIECYIFYTFFKPIHTFHTYRDSSFPRTIYSRPSKFSAGLL